MFAKILIANRGEIACRVLATAKRLGVRTVAVFSDADADSKHVALADEAVHIGPPQAAESYLNSEQIIAAALNTGAQAIHPGYGFLSENPEFVEAVEAAGLIFIGPSAEAIRAMGLKDAAKNLMIKAGVPVVPGYHGERQEADFLAAEADRIGYPVLIKARAGGGGKGMRLVERPVDFVSALEGAQREGLASFGDGACLIEKYITKPRHIEIQVFGDQYGNVVHLFERDCSLQRRHQKVIEEAPAPGMTTEVREAMGEAAVNAAKAIGYAGAGTVEFIVDGSGPPREDGFWFMEMNTRLQVEHPVTEAITGLDLVELQLRVASGEALPFGQDDLVIDGWSFEARVYAEDVYKGFLPSTGVLEFLSFPEATEFARGSVRVDSGVRQGDEISPWYDPMIAKVIVHGQNRVTALNMLSSALADTKTVGPETNLEFLVNLSRNQDFTQGEVDTGLIGRNPDLTDKHPEPPEKIIALAVLGGLGLLRRRTGTDPWDMLAGWRHWTDAKQYLAIEFGEMEIERQVTTLGKDKYRVEGGVEDVTLEIEATDHLAYRIAHNGIRILADIFATETTVTVFVDGSSFNFQLPDALSSASADPSGGDTVFAPMPGTVKVVLAESGQEITRGEPLLILEAMKMEHTLTAPRDGRISEFLASAGDQVAEGVLLVSLENEDG
ncbi:MAG: acetyl/propionyl/methylcrotonyl-CoA carboxylase subunit alpha [Pseudomonadota bacterium]